MQLHSSITKYNDGIHKITSPENTYRNIIKKLKILNPGILKEIKEYKKPQNIPQFTVFGTEYFQSIVNSGPRRHPSLRSNGKGHFRMQAKVNGIMELIERYSCMNYIFVNSSNRKIATFKEMIDNQLNLSLFKNNPNYIIKSNSYIESILNSTKIAWLKGWTLKGTCVYIPAPFLSFAFGTTNGMAAGNSTEEAILHGICEVVERHCGEIIRAKRIVTPVIKLQTISYPIVKTLIKKFQNLNHEIILRDFSLQLGIPVIACIRKIDKNHFFQTVGVATDPQEAIIRALTENSQIDSDKKNSDTLQQYSYLFASSKTIDCNELPDLSNNNLKKEIEMINDLLNKKNMHVYVIDTTDKKLKIPCVYVYINEAHFNPPILQSRSILLSLVEESIRNCDYKSAKNLIVTGIEKEPELKQIYYYFKGIVEAFTKKYKRALKTFSSLLLSESGYEFEYMKLISTGMCRFILNNFKYKKYSYSQFMFTDAIFKPHFIRKHYIF